jgi:phosphopantetheinyl transferase
MSSQSILLPKHEVHLWYFQTDRLLGASEKMVSRYLDASEYQRYKRFSCPNKRQQFLAARVLLKQLLSQYTGEPVEKIRLQYTKQQKPFLEGKLAFNISHSGKHLLIGVARHAIGVDIQEEGATQEEHVFQGLSIQEQQKVSRETLYPWWVLKEALWKADNQETNLVQLLDAMPFCPARAQNLLSFLLDTWCASYLKLFQNLHLAWVVNDPQPVMRLNGTPLKLF